MISGRAGCGVAVSRFPWVQQCNDLFHFNTFNLDPLRETYGIPFYLERPAHWLEPFVVAEAPGGELMGYTTGKAEAQWPGENGAACHSSAKAWNFSAMVWLLNLWSY